MSSSENTVTAEVESQPPPVTDESSSSLLEYARTLEHMFKQQFAAFRNEGQHIEAVNFALSTIQSIPDAPPIWMEYGRALVKLGMPDYAMFCFQHAANLNPQLLTPQMLIGHCILERNNEHIVSNSTYSDSMDLWHSPVDDLFLVEMFNLGLDLHDTGHYHEAIICHQIVLKYRPHITPALHVISTALLSMGDFVKARAYLQIWYNQSVQSLNLSIWHGESLDGKTLLVYADHGIGDYINFVRYLPVLAKQCKKLYFRATPSLWRILGDIPNVVMTLEEPNDYDYICSLYILPHVVGLDDFNNIPQEVPYLHREPDLTAQWAQKLPKGGFRIGIAWQGTPGGPLDRGRSIPVAQYAPIARLPGVKLISLQMNHALDQLDHLPEGMEVTTLGPEFNAGPDNVVDTAAVMQSLDMIISTDTSVPHIAGALGLPVWIILRPLPDWRWLQDREDSPWYPTMRLFRQKETGNWEEVIERIVQELTPILEAKGF